MPDTEHETRRAIEAVLMVAELPVEPQLLAQLLEMPIARVTELCQAMAEEYEAEGRGFSLVSVAGGWRFQSHADLAPYVERFVLEGQSARLSAAALETLAIVAYKQPVSRAQVAAIRGVNVDGVIRTLHIRGFITEVGKDPGPGQAILFGTTSLFLERLGLNGLDQLPPLSEFVPGADVVEHLESGLRPTPGPTLSERLDELEASASGGEAEPREIRLDEIDLGDLDDLDDLDDQGGTSARGGRRDPPPEGAGPGRPGEPANL